MPFMLTLSRLVSDFPEIIWSQMIRIHQSKYSNSHLQYVFKKTIAVMNSLAIVQMGLKYVDNYSLNIIFVNEHLINLLSKHRSAINVVN